MSFLNTDKLQKNLIELSPANLALYMGEARELDIFTKSQTTIVTPNGLEVDEIYQPTKGFKAIHNLQTDTIVGVTKPTYKLVNNRDIVEASLEAIDRAGINAKIDSKHSFTTDAKMRLSLITEDSIFNDGISDTYRTIDIFNGYDGGVSIGIKFGAIREICTNGMVANKTMAVARFRHTKNFELSKIGLQLGKMDMVSENLTNAFQSLNTAKWNKNAENTQEWLAKYFGKRAGKHIFENYIQSDMPATQWEMLQAITWYISHDVEQEKRDIKQEAITKIPEFALI